MNFEEYKRVLRITIKPTREEFKRIVIATSVGISIIGLIGFLLVIGKEMILK